MTWWRLFWLNVLASAANVGYCWWIVSANKPWVAPFAVINLLAAVWSARAAWRCYWRL